MLGIGLQLATVFSMAAFLMVAAGQHGLDVQLELTGI